MRVFRDVQGWRFDALREDFHRGDAWMVDSWTEFPVPLVSAT